MKRIKYCEALEEIKRMSAEIPISLDIARNITHREEGKIPQLYNSQQALKFIKDRYEDSRVYELPLKISLGSQKPKDGLIFLVEKENQASWNCLFFRFGLASNPSSEFQGRPFPYRKPFSQTVLEWNPTITFAYVRRIDDEIKRFLTTESSISRMPEADFWQILKSDCPKDAIREYNVSARQMNKNPLGGEYPTIDENSSQKIVLLIERLGLRSA